MELTNAKVLVIDDEYGMREGMRRLLELQGLQVDTASCGVEGIEKGLAQEYDLYCIDLKMPDMDGAEVLRSIKLAYPEAVCVVVTAFASIDSAVTSTQLGAYRYIPKPFDPEELNSIVQAALERRALILETRQLQEERRRRLLELSHEQSRLRTVISALDDGILVINNQEEIVLFNAAFLSLLEIKTPISIGDSIHAVLPEELCRQISESLAQKNLRAIRQELTVRPPAEKVVMANTTPIVDASGEMIGLISVIRDITELKRIDIMRSQFVNMAAHELKAPLTAVQGYLELMADKALGDNPELYMHYVHRSLERTRALVSLINDLLNISRMEAGKIRREIRRLNLAELINDRLAAFSDDLRRKNISVTTDLDPNVYIEADRDEAARLFNQLISNAIKYNRENGSIRVTVSRESHYAKTAVQYSGIGMTPEEKSRLFEEFFRAKNAYTRDIPGTGLGLIVVKKIVDAYSGMIEVDSEFEKGSTFTVFLPIADGPEPLPAEGKA